MTRLVYAIQSEGEGFQLDPRLETYFQTGVGLTDEQIDLVVGLAHRVASRIEDRGGSRRDAGIEGHFERFGVSATDVDRILAYFTEQEFDAQETEEVLGRSPRAQVGGIAHGLVLERMNWFPAFSSCRPHCPGACTQQG